MSVWSTYPSTYRSAEVKTICAAVEAGECFAVVGLSGAGKSNLIGFLAERVKDGPRFVRVDCNRLTELNAAGLLGLIAECLDAVDPAPGLRVLERTIQAQLDNSPAGLCLLLDRFDAIDASGDPAVTGGLRALRDGFKYSLTYGVAMRRRLDPHSELAELFFANTLWVGPLARADALWSAGQYAARRRLAWDAGTLGQLVDLSWGYPSLLRAVCEAHAGGAPLQLDALRQHPAVLRRVEEFWAGAPSAEDLRRSRLEGHPLLAQAASKAVDPAALTAAEQRLLEALKARAGQVCSKDDLIRAVWPEEIWAGGLRDDSLAQLVHRLREKIEPEPSRPKHIQTVAGRGYRFNA